MYKLVPNIEVLNKFNITYGINTLKRRYEMDTSLGIKARYGTEYRNWLKIKRSSRENNIPIYSVWYNSFIEFYKDTGPKPEPVKTSMLCIYNTKIGYFPGNVYYKKGTTTIISDALADGLIGHASYKAEYNVWFNMIKNAKRDNVYIDASWETDFSKFYIDTGAKPIPTDEYHLSIIKHDNGYVPGNVQYTPIAKNAYYDKYKGTTIGLMHIIGMDMVATKRNNNKTCVITKCVNCGSVNSKVLADVIRKNGTCMCNKSPFGANSKDMPEYSVWCNIKTRCYNPNSDKYSYYGGSGITMISSWRNSFKQFVDDMGRRKNMFYEIDRIISELGYCKANCRWIPKQLNLINRNPPLGESGYRGVKVSYNKIYTMYHNQIHSEHPTSEEAARTYDNLMIKEYGYEYAYTNLRLGLIKPISEIEKKHVKFFDDVKKAAIKEFLADDPNFKVPDGI